MEPSLSTLFGWRPHRLFQCAIDADGDAFGRVGSDAQVSDGDGIGLRFLVLAHAFRWSVNRHREVQFFFGIRPLESVFPINNCN